MYLKRSPRISLAWPGRDTRAPAPGMYAPNPPPSSSSSATARSPVFSTVTPRSAATGTYAFTGPPGHAGPVPSLVPGGMFWTLVVMWCVASTFPGSTWVADTSRASLNGRGVYKLKFGISP